MDLQRKDNEEWAREILHFPAFDKKNFQDTLILDEEAELLMSQVRASHSLRVSQTNDDADYYHREKRNMSHYVSLTRRMPTNNFPGPPLLTSS